MNIVKGTKFDISLSQSGKTLTVYYKGFLGSIKNSKSFTVKHIQIVAYNKGGRFTDSYLKFVNITDNEVFESLYKDKEALEQIIQEIGSVEREIKSTCNKCGKVWHFSEYDLLMEKSKIYRNIGKSLTAMGGLPSLSAIPNEELKDHTRCMECGTRDVSMEEVVYKKNKKGKKEII